MDKTSRTLRLGWPVLGWGTLALLGLAIALPDLGLLWRLWRADAALSHGPLILLISGALLWVRRERLREWNSACLPGLFVMAFSGLAHVAAIWADIEFLKPLSLIGIGLGGVWFLGGLPAVRESAGALGFLCFAIPWPTTLMERLSFPMQLASSTYAAMMAGMIGLPIHRDGVYIEVVFPSKVAYSILVAQGCSGLTSMTVLLALGYLIAYHTQAPSWIRGAMVLAIIPLALFNNAVRLTLILLAGTYVSSGFAQWVHDNEAPFLVLFCSIGMLLIRHLVLSWMHRPRPEPEVNRDAQMAIITG